MLRWQNGLFLPEVGASFDAAEHDRRVEDTFVAVVRKLASQKRDVSPNKGPSYAPAVVAEHPDGGAFRSQEYAKVMERLLDGGKARVEEHGPPSKRRHRIIIVEASELPPEAPF